MSETLYALLPDRAVIRVSGPDRVSFLQGLVSNNIETISPEKSGYGALLSPQGKFLFDFFIYHQDEDSLLIECERGENGERAAELFKKLRMYKLRAKAELTDVSDSYDVIAVFGKDALSSLSLDATPGATAHMADGIKAVDPRLAAMGARVLLPKNALAEMAAIGAEESDVETYHQMRVMLGIPNGSEEMEVDKSILLESGFEELGGVDFKKGCYMGQELTARTKYRGLVRKRLLPVKIDGPAPNTGTPIMNGDKEAGIIRSVHGEFGLALVRLERVDDDADLRAGDAKVTVSVPDWVQLPENAA
ncbi:MULTISPECIES: folate-binding protein YgfZ [Thalassospira]|uniref:Aminomethyltransferase n=1 Tax=Thalassospira profundimaris TaxID=502049 RepID=A0A367V621_9PROT|nr:MULTISPECIES: folate-binding protein YgfZ [Thalassospira]KZB70640.1 aminomethyltransferase [Thalassospira sp. MCCC 1A01148]MBR9899679.1 folate-binding protein YgfZ [Rhodospirillales bacterium]RCK19812.1 aminomethyltransferase [Thalassospira profundimaris]|tara:strand:+ start:4329 stop:5243 length:915 start_codon:yes stop_codon:yes gene_type:complete